MHAICVRSEETFDVDFPPVAVGGRTGAGARTHDDTDLWTARRILQALVAERVMKPPLILLRVPATHAFRTTDFVIVRANTVICLEITQGTAPEDQKEMTLSESVDGPVSFGSLGGRGVAGMPGDAPLRLTSKDVRQAVQTKARHYPRKLRRRTILGVYANSNPAFFVRKLSKLRRIRRHGFKRVVVVKDDGHYVF